MLYRFYFFAACALVVLSGCIAVEPYGFAPGHPASPESTTVVVDDAPSDLGAYTLPTPQSPLTEDEVSDDSVSGHEHADAAPADADLYTCPMHPEIVQRGPGRCPICEMPLVRKLELDAESGDRP